MNKQNYIKKNDSFGNIINTFEGSVEDNSDIVLNLLKNNPNLARQLFTVKTEKVSSLEEAREQQVAKYSFANQASLEESTAAGCYYCCRIYSPEKIKEYTIEKDGRNTALCPFCGIDAVVPSATVPGLNYGLLTQLNRRF